MLIIQRLNSIWHPDVVHVGLVSQSLVFFGEVTYNRVIVNVSRKQSVLFKVVRGTSLIDGNVRVA